MFAPYGGKIELLNPLLLEVFTAQVLNKLFGFIAEPGDRCVDCKGFHNEVLELLESRHLGVEMLSVEGSESEDCGEVVPELEVPMGRPPGKLLEWEGSPMLAEVLVAFTTTWQTKRWQLTPRNHFPEGF